MPPAVSDEARQASGCIGHPPISGRLAHQTVQSPPFMCGIVCTEPYTDCTLKLSCCPPNASRRCMSGEWLLGGGCRCCGGHCCCACCGGGGASGACGDCVGCWRVGCGCDCGCAVRTCLIGAWSLHRSTTCRISLRVCSLTLHSTERTV